MNVEGAVTEAGGAVLRRYTAGGVGCRMTSGAAPEAEAASRGGWRMAWWWLEATAMCGRTRVKWTRRRTYFMRNIVDIVAGEDVPFKFFVEEDRCRRSMILLVTAVFLGDGKFMLLGKIIPLVVRIFIFSVHPYFRNSQNFSFRPITQNFSFRLSLFPQLTE